MDMAMFALKQLTNDLDRDMVRKEKDAEKNFQAAQVAVAGGVQRSNKRASTAWLTHGDDVEQVLRAAGGAGPADATLEVEALIRMIGASAMHEGVDVPEQAYYVRSQNVTGEAVKGEVRLHVVLEVSLLRSRWAVVPLFTNNVAVLSCELSVIPDTEQQPVQSAAAPAPRAERPPSEEFPAIVSVMDIGPCLVVRTAATYKVCLDLLAPYSSKSETGFSIRSPMASESTLRVRVPMSDAQVSVVHALKTTVLPPPSGGGTEVICLLAPSDKLTVQWTRKLEEEEEEGAAADGGMKSAALACTVQQHSLFSIGEGLLSGSTTFDFKITSGGLSMIEIEVDSEAKVVGVEGLGLKRWDILQPSGASSAAEGDAGEEARGHEAEDGQRRRHRRPRASKTPVEDDEGAAAAVEGEGGAGHAKKRKRRKVAGPAFRILKIWLEYGLEDAYNLTVLTECDVSGQACSLHRMHVRGMERQTGHLAIEARTNVEIEASRMTDVVPVDVSELPDALSSKAKKAILLSYSFVNPKFKLTLVVSKHEELPVLVAGVSSAYMRVTVSEEGSILTSLACEVRNTQRQYARLLMPEGSAVWSTSVEGRGVKPAVDAEGRLLIPLEKASAVGKGGEKTSVFEVVTCEKMDAALGDSGTLELSFPSVDIPISLLFVSFFLPSNYKWGEFSGALREVLRFSERPHPSPQSTRRLHGPPMGQLMASQANVFYAPVESDEQDMDGDEIAQNDFFELGEMVQTNVAPIEQMAVPSMSVMDTTVLGGKAKSKSASLAAGTLPVKVELPSRGTEFRFEQRIVMETLLHTSVRYRRVRKPYWQRRHLSYCTIM